MDEPEHDQPTATRCVNDTDGDGDCAACARNPQALCRQPIQPMNMEES